MAQSNKYTTNNNNIVLFHWQNENTGKENPRLLKFVVSVQNSRDGKKKELQQKGEEK